MKIDGQIRQTRLSVNFGVFWIYSQLELTKLVAKEEHFSALVAI